VSEEAVASSRQGFAKLQQEYLENQELEREENEWLEE